MKKLKKGFTLIELLVVIAIIGILTTIITPKLREQLAKSKDAKAVDLLANIRTVSEVIILEKTTSTTKTSISFGEILDKIEEKKTEIVNDDGSIEVGGIRQYSPETNDYNLQFGGEVYVFIEENGDVFTDKTTLKKISDDVVLHLGTDVVEDKSVEEKLWIKY